MSTLPQFTFDTDQVVPEHRFEAWRALLGVTHDIAAQSSDFSARVTSTSIDRIIVREMSASPQAVGRSRQRVRSDGLDHFVLHLTTASFNASTEDGEIHAPTGSITFNALSQPFRRTAAPERQSHILSLSRDLVAEVLPDPDAFHGAVLTGGVGQILAAHMTTTVRHAHLIAPEQAEGVARASAHLLAAALAPTRRALGESQRSREAAVLVRCKRYIEHHLTSANLSPDAICRQVGISRSVLYRLFAEAGGVARYIKGRRLRAARAALSTAAGSKRISEVAYSVGFTDLPTFSRAFKQAYGVNPSDVAGSAISAADPAEIDLFAEWVRAVTL